MNLTYLSQTGPRHCWISETARYVKHTSTALSSWPKIPSLMKMTLVSLLLISPIVERPTPYSPASSSCVVPFLRRSRMIRFYSKVRTTRHLFLLGQLAFFFFMDVFWALIRICSSSRLTPDNPSSRIVKVWISEVPLFMYMYCVTYTLYRMYAITGVWVN